MFFTSFQNSFNLISKTIKTDFLIIVCCFTLSHFYLHLIRSPKPPPTSLYQICSPKPSPCHQAASCSSDLLAQTTTSLLFIISPHPNHHRTTTSLPQIHSAKPPLCHHQPPPSLDLFATNLPFIRSPHPNHTTAHQWPPFHQIQLPKPPPASPPPNLLPKPPIQATTNLHFFRFARPNNHCTISI